MAAKTFKYYPFKLSANGTQIILASGEYFRVQSATGPLDVTVESVGTLPEMLVGQGLKDTPFQRLIIKDASGAANTGSILIASQEFIDNRTYGVVDLSAANILSLIRPELPSSAFAQSAVLGVNGTLTIFSAATNLNGALISSAGASVAGTSTSPRIALIAKAAAPTTEVDGQILMFASSSAVNGTQIIEHSQLSKEVLIPANLGLFFISGNSGAGSFYSRYKLL